MIEKQYLKLLKRTLHHGSIKCGRNGDTRHLFGAQLRHNMRLGFPLLTTKEVWAKGALTELMWILQGRTDIQFLHDHGVRYWDKDYKASGRTDGTLGPVYGYQIRHGFYVDQLEELLLGLRNDPNGRRHLVTMWNPNDTDKMALPPCHYSFQVNIDGGYMDLMWNQRSADLFLGVPFDIAMYGFLLELLAKGMDKTPRNLVGNLGDCHIYEPHVSAVREQLDRKVGAYPTALLKSGGIYLKDGEVHIPAMGSVEIENYNPQSKITAELI